MRPAPKVPCGSGSPMCRRHADPLWSAAGTSGMWFRWFREAVWDGQRIGRRRALQSWDHASKTAPIGLEDRRGFSTCAASGRSPPEVERMPSKWRDPDGIHRDPPGRARGGWRGQWKVMPSRRDFPVEDLSETSSRFRGLVSARCAARHCVTLLAVD